MQRKDYMCRIIYKNHICKEDFAWNSSICVCEWNKDSKIGEYSKNFTYTKKLIGDLVVACDEIVAMPKTALINSTSKTNDWFICVLLLAIVCLLLLVVIDVKYHMKHGLPITCFMWCSI